MYFLNTLFSIAKLKCLVRDGHYSLSDCAATFCEVSYKPEIKTVYVVMQSLVQLRNKAQLPSLACKGLKRS